MLTSTFAFLQGIGPVTERRLWRAGLLDWRSFVRQPRIAGFSPDRKSLYDHQLILAQSQFDTGHLRLLASRFRGREHWRFYDACRSRTVYLDIETTGAPPHRGEVTVVVLHRNGQTTTLVQGTTLTADRLQSELDTCDLLVTFFGTGFDVPYLRVAFPELQLAIPHFDLCLAARRLGWHGGLKSIEQTAGIERDPSLQGLDGLDAVRLWSQWRRGDRAALAMLLDYNRADTENLVPLADLIYKEMTARFGPSSVGSAPVSVPGHEALPP